MGGVFRALLAPPRVPSPPPPPPPAPEPEPAAEEDRDRAAKEAAQEKERRRRRRGLAETIITSPRGVLRAGRFAPVRKRLLGE